MRILPVTNNHAISKRPTFNATIGSRALNTIDDAFCYSCKRFGQVSKEQSNILANKKKEYIKQINTFLEKLDEKIVLDIQSTNNVTIPHSLTESPYCLDEYEFVLRHPDFEEPYSVMEYNRGFISLDEIEKMINRFNNTGAEKINGYFHSNLHSNLSK